MLHFDLSKDGPLYMLTDQIEALIVYIEGNIYIYYTSREFPIQNFHRRTTDIL